MNREPITRVQEKPIPGGMVVKTELERLFKGFDKRVRGDCIFKMEAGEEKYGSPLMTRNGRIALLDAYQDLLDTINYTVQAYLEEKDPNEREWLRMMVDGLFSIAGRMRNNLINKGVLDNE